MGDVALRSLYLAVFLNATHRLRFDRLPAVTRVTILLFTHFCSHICLIMISANVLLFNRIICGGVFLQGHSTETVHMSMMTRVVMFVFFGVAATQS